MAKRKKKEIEEELVAESNPLDELDLTVSGDDMVINLEDVDDSGPAPLPPGKYKGVVTNAELTTSQAGNPMVKIELTLQDSEGSNRKVWDNYVLNNSVGLARLKQLAKIAVPEELAKFNVKRVKEYFIGKVVGVQVKVEPGTGQYKDRLFNRVQRIEPWTEVEEIF